MQVARFSFYMFLSSPSTFVTFSIACDVGRILFKSKPLCVSKCIKIKPVNSVYTHMLTFRCSDPLVTMDRSEDAVLHNPLQVVVHTGIDAWSIRFSATDTPGYNANCGPATARKLQHERSSRVTLNDQTEPQLIQWSRSFLRSSQSLNLSGNTPPFM